MIPCFTFASELFGKARKIRKEQCSTPLPAVSVKDRDLFSLLRVRVSPVRERVGRPPQRSSHPNPWHLTEWGPKVKRLFTLFPFQNADSYNEKKDEMLQDFGMFLVDRIGKWFLVDNWRTVTAISVTAIP